MAQKLNGKNDGEKKKDYISEQKNLKEQEKTLLNVKVLNTS